MLTSFECVSDDDNGNDDVVERPGIPPLGSRVVRGKDWKWGNQDCEGPGTIVTHLDG